ncbi:hypothetical protein IWQ49_000897 [Labrenzia sp. EL_126]|nr:hypothetical protein [Labrenzia sp. EL_126]
MIGLNPLDFPIEKPGRFSVTSKLGILFIPMISSFRSLQIMDNV